MVSWWLNHMVSVLGIKIKTLGERIVKWVFLMLLQIMINNSGYLSSHLIRSLFLGWNKFSRYRIQRHLTLVHSTTPLHSLCLEQVSTGQTRWQSLSSNVCCLLDIGNTYRTQRFLPSQPSNMRSVKQKRTIIQKKWRRKLKKISLFQECFLKQFLALLVRLWNVGPIEVLSIKNYS